MMGRVRSRTCLEFGPFVMCCWGLGVLVPLAPIQRMSHWRHLMIHFLFCSFGDRRSLWQHHINMKTLLPDVVPSWWIRAMRKAHELSEVEASSSGRPGLGIFSICGSVEEIGYNCAALLQTQPSSPESQEKSSHVSWMPQNETVNFQRSVSESPW